jgi:hypothetical protein
MTELLALVLILIFLRISFQLHSLIQKVRSLDPIFAQLTEGVAGLTDAVDAIIQSQDNLFAALQTALANQAPADAVAAVQAVIDVAKAKQAAILADIAKDTVIPPPVAKV